MTCQARHDLAHRVVVISQGQVVFESDARNANRLALGSHRGGHNGEHSVATPTRMNPPNCPSPHDPHHPRPSV